MFRMLIDFTNELKRCSNFEMHLSVCQDFRKMLGQEEINLLKKSCPNFPNALGYVSAVEVLKANRSRSDLPLILKPQIDKILSFESLDVFLESCKIVGKIMDELFLEIVGVLQRTSNCIRILSPKGRKLLYEMQSLVHRKGLVLNLFQLSVPYQGVIPVEASKLEQLANSDKYFFPTNKYLRKEIIRLSGNDLELKKYLQFFLNFICFKKIFLDLMYELMMDNVPFVSRESFYRKKEKSIGNVLVFKGSTTVPIFMIPNINYFMFEDQAHRINDLLIVAGNTICFKPEELDITIKGLIINSSFRFI